jgi:hypothetical protein
MLDCHEIRLIFAWLQGICVWRQWNPNLCLDGKGNSNSRAFHSMKFIFRYSLYSDVSSSPVGLASYYEMAEVVINVYGAV